jgi:CBS domain-containing protein
LDEKGRRVNKMVELDIRDVKIEDVYETMVGKPALVDEEAILKDAVEAMTVNHVSRKVYVVDSQGKLLGVISIETLLKKVGYLVGVRKTGVLSFIKFVSGIFDDNVTEYMDTPVTVTNNHKVLDALKKMVEYHLNDLPVVDEEGKIIGELNSLELLEEAKKIFDE